MVYDMLNSALQLRYNYEMIFSCKHWIIESISWVCMWVFFISKVCLNKFIKILSYYELFCTIFKLLRSISGWWDSLVWTVSVRYCSRRNNYYWNSYKRFIRIFSSLVNYKFFYTLYKYINNYFYCIILI